MEAPVSHVPFWIHELVAEARRRARQRRLLVLLLVVVVAGVAAAVVLRPTGGRSSSGGLSGRLGGISASSQSVHFGAFVLTVPKGFHQYEVGAGASLQAFFVAHHPRAASTLGRPSASQVFLWVQADAPPRLLAPKLPLDLHKLHRWPGFAYDGTAWQDVIYGGPRGLLRHEGYSVIVFEGSKASAADRAAIERALRSIRRAS